MRVVLACLAAVLIGAPGAALSEAPGSPDEPAYAALESRLETLRRRYAVPAVAWTLVEGPRTRAGALGLADLGEARPATPDTLFRVGSVTKTFTALLAVRLSEAGLLDLQAPVRSLTPDIPLRNPWATRHPVRLVHLLEHTAGLLDLTRAEFDFNTPVSLKAGLGLAPEARVCRWPPGLHASYTNAGYGLAGYAIEQHAGAPWEDLLSEWVLRPLGMRRASLAPDRATRAALATGYDTDGRTVIPYWHMVFRPFGALNASPREMAGLLRLFLDDGRAGGRRLLSRAAIRRMERPTTTLAARDGLRYGYGLGSYAFAYGGRVFHGHGGDGDGYLSHYAYQRDSGRGYFVVINAFKGDALLALREAVQDYLLRDQAPGAMPPLARPADRDLAELTGTYEAVTWRFPWETKRPRAHLEVTLDHGRLYTREAGGMREALLPVTRRHFRRAGEPVATIAFVRHEDEWVLQGDMGNYRRLDARP